MDENIYIEPWEKEADFLVGLKSENILNLLNNKFLILVVKKSYKQNEIRVYDLNYFSIIGSFNLEELFYINFHKHFENIFFVCSEKNVVIYYIDTDNKTIKEISTVKGHFSYVTLADFSPLNADIMASISQSYDIKIYNLKRSLPISHIFLNEPFTEDIKWNEKEIGVRAEKKIIIFDYSDFSPDDVKKFLFKEEVMDFHFYQDKDIIYPLIVITKNDIQYALNPDYIYSIYKIDNSQYLNNFYNNKLKYLVIFFRNQIQIISCSIKGKLIFLKDTNEFRIFNPILLFDEKELKNGEICKFYGKDFPMINSFRLIMKTPTNENESIPKATNENESIPKPDLQEFLKGIINNISDIPLLLSKNNNIKYNYTKNKNYFDFVEIEKELEDIKKKNLFDRKEFVKNNKDKILEIEDVKERYIFCAKLLVNDNTNQELLNIYLSFLRDDKEKLKSYLKDINEYKTELNYYLNIISFRDALRLFKTRKSSQKQELINLLDNILNFNVDNIMKFEIYLNKFKDFLKNVIYYNMPANSDNEELCYNGLINLIKYSLKNINERFNEKKKENENEKDEFEKIKKIIKF